MRHKFMQCVEDPDQFDVDADQDFGASLFDARKMAVFSRTYFVYTIYPINSWQIGARTGHCYWAVGKYVCMGNSTELKIRQCTHMFIL